MSADRSEPLPCTFDADHVGVGMSTCKGAPAASPQPAGRASSKGCRCVDCAGPSPHSGPPYRGPVPDWEWRITESLQLSGTTCLPDASFPPIQEILRHIRNDIYNYILWPEPDVVEVRQVTDDDHAPWHRLNSEDLTVEQNQRVNINNGLQIIEAELWDGATLDEGQRQRLRKVLGETA